MVAGFFFVTEMRRDVMGIQGVFQGRCYPDMIEAAASV